MPIAPTYPGVYVEEIPSGVRTITGVATSITAFVGRTLRGPSDDDEDSPVTINNFGDFTRTFGELHVDYPLSYAVRDFYANGGRQAIIARLQKNADKAKNTDLKLEAASYGQWGNSLTFKVDYNDITDEVAARFDLTSKDDLFNLTVFDDPPRGAVEVFRSVTFKTSGGSRRLDRVLAEQSRLVRVQLKNDGTPNLVTTLPSQTTADADPSNPGADRTKFAKFSGGKDGADLDAKTYQGDQGKKTGLFALEKADLFNLLCLPPDKRGEDVPDGVYSNALTYCVKRRAMLLLDPPTDWGSANDITKSNNKGLTDLNLSGNATRNAAIYFPRVIESDPERAGQTDTFVPCGLIAGAFARTDAERGVWKAPAGIDVSITGVEGLAVRLTDDENGQLNPIGVNCLRSFPLIGPVIWGARTLRGADAFADEYKYVPVRRLALYIEESLYRGTKWVVFEPNDEPLWAQIRLNVGAFMHDLFRQRAFQGQAPKDAYFVKCDKETTTQNDIDHGIVNILVGFAPLKPAEFVFIKIQQIAGQIQT